MCLNCKQLWAYDALYFLYKYVGSFTTIKSNYALAVQHHIKMSDKQLKLIVAVIDDEYRVTDVFTLAE